MKSEIESLLYYKTSSFPTVMNKWGFITQIVDILGNPIEGHELADHCLVGQSWAKCHSWIKKAEKRCIKSGIKNFYSI